MGENKKMTENEMKDWLKSIKIYTDEMDNILEQIIALRVVAENCTVRTDKESIQTLGSGDKMANIVGKIVDLEKKLTDIDKRTIERRNTFEKVTKLMQEDKQRQFLTIRYFDGHGFYDTVMLMDLKDSTARRIHRKAITEFTKIYNEITVSPV